MRVIEKQMIEAIQTIRKNKASSNKWASGNTEVVRKLYSPIEVRLHGNLIACLYDNELKITLAGWNTPTTRSRLNALIKEFGTMHGISTSKGQATLYRSEPDNARVVVVQPITNNEWVRA
jgi:hypothetical protein